MVNPPTRGHRAAEMPVIGVLGGMGPAATADFFSKLVRATPAGRDQDHLRVLVWSDSQIPERSGAPSLCADLIAGLNLLKNGGATLFAMPCNTAHIYLQELREATGVALVSMVDATVEHLRSHSPRDRRVGLLATNATLAAGLYTKELVPHGIETEMPTGEMQDHVTRAIAQAKAGEWPDAYRTLVPALDHFRERGVTAVVAACTEIPVILDGRWESQDLDVIDPAMILAREIVDTATGMGGQAAPAILSGH